MLVNVRFISEEACHMALCVVQQATAATESAATLLVMFRGQTESCTAHSSSGWSGSFS